MRHAWVAVVVLGTLLGLLGAQPPAPVVHYAPQDGVLMAADDLATVPAHDRPYMRYLWLGHLPDAAVRDDWYALIAFAAASLSREPPPIIRPAPLPGPAGPLLVRVDLRDYTWKPEFIDNLAEKGSGPAPRFESFFQAKLEIVETVFADEKVVENGEYIAGYDAQGNPFKVIGPHYVIKKVKVSEKKIKKLQAAPWVGLNDGKGRLGPDGKPRLAIAFLQDWCQTAHPILRGDWFVTFALLEPRYHEFLELGDREADFEKLVFADSKTADKARTRRRGAVLHSRVAHHNRALDRLPTLGQDVGGMYWESFDFLKSTDANDLAADFLNLKPDAKEIIATLANGLHAYFVVNGKDQRLDKADNEVAEDFLTKSSSKTIRVAYNCMACHAADNGIRFINDFVRKLSSKKLKLLIPDDAKYRRVQDLFGKDLGPIVEADRAFYTAAVSAACGLKPKDLSDKLYERVREYLEAPVTLEAAAGEAGMDSKELDQLLKHAINLDARLVGFTQTPPEGARRDQWDATGFPSLMQLILEVKAQQAPKK